MHKIIKKWGEILINNIIDKILDFCNGNITLLIILLSIIPLLELRIAIPFALSTSLNINPFTVFSISVSSTLIVIPLILLLLKPIIKLLNKSKVLNKLSTSLEDYFSTKANNLDKKADDNLTNPNLQSQNKKTHLKNFFINNRIYFYLFLFVALPLPLTGYYTGSAIAAFLGLNFYKSTISIFMGNVVAGLIITFFSSIFNNSAIFILLLFIAIIFITIILKLIKKFYHKKNIVE